MKRLGRKEKLFKGFMTMLLTLTLVLSGWMGDGTGYVYADEGSDESEVRITEEGTPVEDPSIVNEDDSIISEDPEEASPSDAEDMATAVYSQSGLYGFSPLSQEQIKSMYAAAMNITPSRIFSVEPSVSSPYTLGELDDIYLDTGLTYLNFYRSIANLNQVAMSDDLIYGSGGAQYGAVLLAAEDNFGHTPPQPADMDNDFYSNGYAATGSSNLSARMGYCPANSLRSAVIGCMDDKNSTGNLTTMGHRRWFLNPTLGNVGFGYAQSAAGWSYIDMKVFDRSAVISGYDFISWLGSGNVPNEIVDTRTPWSVTLNPSLFNTSQSVLEEAVVTVTRISDGKKWTITNASDKSSPTGSDTVDSYFHVNTGGYGISNCLIFHIGSDNVGADNYIGDYEVVISGLKDKSGNPAMLDYTINFFSMGVDMSKAEGHIYDDGVITRQPTCLSTGYKTFTCSFCGSKRNEYLDFADHSWDAGTITTAATCTTKGAKKYTCTVCYKTKTEEIPAKGHSLVTDKAVAATCTSNGKTEGSHCSVCNTVIKAQQTVAASGHSWNAGVVTKEAICTAKGTKTYTCTKCKAIKTEEIPAKGHTVVTDKAVAATCTASGKTEGSHCSVCNTVIKSQQTVAASGHSWNAGVVTKEATCTSKGIKTFTCTKCKVTKTEEIPAKGHTIVTDKAVAATCTASGKTEGSHCSVCGTVIKAQQTVAKTGHTWNDGEITKQPTTSQTGVMTYTCTKCNSTKTETIPKLGEKKPSVAYTTHVQSIGWQSQVRDGQLAGTVGDGKRLEAIMINLENVSYSGGIEYRTHVETYGWQDWVKNGELSGTSGEAKRLEAIQIKLTGDMAKKYDVYYRIQVQTFGWLGWAKNGEYAGSAGHAKRLESIQVALVEKGQAIDKTSMDKLAGITSATKVTDSTAYVTKAPSVKYTTHVQTYGWQDWVRNGDMAGTSGQSKRLEGIMIDLSRPPYEGGIRYKTHVQTYGWQGWRYDGDMSGTSGEAKRLEAIAIELTGEMAEHYDVYYRVHAQTYGWLSWAKNGAAAGTAGLAKRLEGIQIVLVEKGQPAPGKTYNGITATRNESYIEK
ncbi:MAG: hypothetical protein IJ065_10285 [Eubacterium sp.]|nr:hypothetical protein [Eubacterium sp.]